jgi:hypothetical protein
LFPVEVNRSGMKSNPDIEALVKLLVVCLRPMLRVMEGST